jgi:glucans biosynthesis protein
MPSRTRVSPERSPLVLSVRRRMLLAAATALVASAPAPLRATVAAESGLRFGAAAPFSWDALVARAEAMAKEPYRAPYRPAPDIVERIDYDAHGKIKFRAADAPFADGPGPYPVTFFHLGRYFGKAVRMHLVEQGAAREILYSPTYFDMPPDSPARDLPADSGFAGFRLQEFRTRDDWPTQDWVAFLGASYFRAIGALGQYGLSARGLAVDVAVPSVPEEFPDFTNVYIAESPDPADPVQVWALLDSPRVAGAFAFRLSRTAGVVMEVEAALFLRGDIARLGLAPLTSMFWYGEYGRGRLLDWRPEIHDSDGLALWTGAGERIWRPLNNPPSITVSSFVDDSPRGFGLLQRDRNFDHFLDGVRYDRRPSLWVEPLDGWGAGAVELVEIPTDDEIHDNIVTFWVPREPAVAGNSYRLRYRLHWLEDEPFPAYGVARTVATRFGRGGEPGKLRPAGVTKFVVEFEGRGLAEIPYGVMPKVVVTASRGSVSLAFAEPVPDTRRWRITFDLAAEGIEPVELRLYMRMKDRPLTETWLFQYHPEAKGG